MVVKALKRGYFINRYNHIPVQTLKLLKSLPDTYLLRPVLAA